MKLIIKLLAGIVAGVLLGLVAPEGLLRAMATFKGLFGQLIGFVIPLLIFFYVTNGIAHLQKGSGRLLGLTVVISYLSTLAAGSLAFLAASNIVPEVMGAGMEMPHAAQAIAPFVDLKIPPVMGVMSALVAAFVFGIGISALNLAKLRELSDEGCAIIGLVLGRALIPALPYYIACVFGILAAQGTVFETFQAFGLVLATAISTQWLWLAALFLIAALMSGSSPRRMMRTMLPAYFTAVGTMSSAASMPVTLRQTKELGVTDEVANFTVPLCSTIHMCGSIISIVTGATAVMFIMPGMAIPDWNSMIPFILVLGVTMVAAPGVPGGAVMAALGLLGSMLGFGETAAALMIALHMAQDSFGTACNVTGDGALSVMVDRMTSRKGETALASQQA